ncbi:tail fiber domain-containing protein [Blastomonas sp. AAP25]|uniref:tail fiber domain-containing protein n=1 Tax=Blastomonas sp. AAP25 TaxID=1523416 RepID=UPI0006B91E5D|nr:tail fiber domain-containing protein [Blastomonas sp. AAP25]
MAWYRTGTVTVTNGSATITGSGTAFIANASIGEGFLGPDGRTYEITNIASDTSMSISPNYQGSTAGGQGYAIAPLRGRIAELIAESSSLLASFANVRDGVGAGLFPDGSSAAPAFRFASDQDTGVYRIGSNSFGFASGGVLRALIGADGQFEVKTPATGQSLRAESTVFDPSANNRSAILASGGYGGGILLRDNTGYSGFWAQDSGATLRIGFGSATLTARLDLTASEMFPSFDNGYTLGKAGNRFSVLYAATGSINTSDERNKHWRGALNTAELRAARRIIAELGMYQWNDAVAQKGEDNARLHFGIRAQQAFSIMEDEGLDWTRYAWCCFDEWEGGERYGVRPDQLAFWLIAAQAAVQADLETRLATLEAA